MMKIGKKLMVCLLAGMMAFSATACMGGGNWGTTSTGGGNSSSVAGGGNSSSVAGGGNGGGNGGDNGGGNGGVPVGPWVDI